MRSKALSFLLSLSLMFCVGFGSSLTASAADFSAYNGYNVYYSTLESPNTSMLYISKYTNGVTTDFFNKVTTYVDGVHHVDNTTLQGANVVRLTHNGGEFYFPINNEIFNYYIVGVYQSVDTNDSFWPNRCTLTCIDNSGNYFYPEYYFSASDAGIISNNTNLLRGFSFYFKVDFSNFAGFSSISLNQTYNSNSVIGKNVNLGLSVVEIHKSASSEQVDSIITAIQNQTSSLAGKIDDAADDIQQSIEDQYGGDPGNSFPVDDIITQHNEKMGVLSFSSDALMQVLGLLSPDQTLSSELVFPSMSLTIAGQRNRVQLWPEYRFDLNTLKQHWPDFIGLMQSLTSALVWIFVLRYCYRVFEKYFLAGGGS